MGITPTSLEASGSGSSATSYATGSVSPASNALILASVYSAYSGSDTTPTCSGNGLTWVQVATQAFSTTRLTLFRAMGSPSSGAVTFDWAGTTQDRASWVITQFTGVDTSGSNGSGAVVQSVSNAVFSSSLTLTLGSAITAGNATYGRTAFTSIVDTVSVGSGYTQISSTTAGGSYTGEDEWRSDGQTTVNWGSSDGNHGFTGIGIEVKAALRAVFQTPPLSGVGIGGSFYRDPLQSALR